MIRAATGMSLILSIFLFHLWLSRWAIIPLLIAMYLIFTNGQLQKSQVSRQFSRYHILFALRCIIMVGISLLLHVFWFSLFIILCALLGIHMCVIRITCIAEYEDENTMFHIWYYFIAAILLWYMPMAYWFHTGVIAWLLFPIASFILYAGGSFFINPFVPLPLQWHYRTAVFFIISFLTSIILYFFSIPLVGRAAALILYTGIVRLFVYQYISFQRHEKRKDVHAEDILAWKKVVQEAEWAWHSAQEMLVRIIDKLSLSRRTIIVWLGSILCIWTITSAFFAQSQLGNVTIFLILVVALISYYYSISGWHQLRYPTTSQDSLVGAFIHAIFIWSLLSYVSVYSTTFVFICILWTIVHHGISILLAWQAQLRKNERKYPLLYGYSGSTTLLSVSVLFLLNQLGLENTLVRAVGLLYVWAIGTMLYFFSRARKTN
jgi:hypothetical protein